MICPRAATGAAVLTLFPFRSSLHDLLFGLTELLSVLYPARSVWGGPWVDPPDSYMHLGISAVLTIVVYLRARHRGVRRGRAVALAVALTMLVGLGRELWNLYQSITMPWMFFSMKDMTWNAAGVVLGLLVTRR